MKILFLLLFSLNFSLYVRSQSFYGFLETNPKAFVVIKYLTDSSSGKYITNYSILKRYLLSVDTSLRNDSSKLCTLLDSLFSGKKSLNVGFKVFSNYWEERENGKEKILLIDAKNLDIHKGATFNKFFADISTPTNKRNVFEFNYHSKYRYSKQLIDYLFTCSVIIIEGDGHIYLFDLRNTRLHKNTCSHKSTKVNTQCP